ncbi:MAG: putative zinc-binding protein [bacterium]
MDTSNNTKQTVTTTASEFEIIHLEKTKKVCGLCEKFSTVKAEQNDLMAIISCEGACLRGEISRRVANRICFENPKDNIARVCIGGAFTKDTGQRNMVRKAKRVIALEGCVIECASRMMKGVIPNLKPELIFVDQFYTFNKNLFAINDVTEDELIKFTDEAFGKIKDIIGI